MTTMKLLRIAVLAAALTATATASSATRTEAFAETGDCSFGSTIVCRIVEITYWTCEEWKWTQAGSTVVFTCARWKQVRYTSYEYWKVPPQALEEGTP